MLTPNGTSYTFEGELVVDRLLVGDVGDHFWRARQDSNLRPPA